ncbi:MAG: hypothetical protein RSD95_09735 [Clostridia bacterium]
MLKPDFTFVHSAVIRPWLRHGLTGPEYGSPISLRGRFDFSRTKTKSANAAAQEVIASGTVFFPAGTRLEPESLIAFDGKSYSVLSARPCFGWGGESHVEVTIR